MRRPAVPRYWGILFYLHGFASSNIANLLLFANAAENNDPSPSLPPPILTSYQFAHLVLRRRSATAGMPTLCSLSDATNAVQTALLRRSMAGSGRLC